MTAIYFHIAYINSSSLLSRGYNHISYIYMILFIHHELDDIQFKYIKISNHLIENNKKIFFVLQI
jgi:hypothetical protein